MNEFSAILPSCGLWSMLSFFLSCLREAIFPYGKREHARPHTIDGMQKYSKTHVSIKVKNVLFVNYALFFVNRKPYWKHPFNMVLRQTWCTSKNYSSNSVEGVSTVPGWRVRMCSISPCSNAFGRFSVCGQPLASKYCRPWRGTLIWNTLSRWTM